MTGVSIHVQDVKASKQEAMYDPKKPYKKQIYELIKRTWDAPYVSVKDGIYPMVKKKFSYLEVDHSDGIGTKGIYHWQKGTHKFAVVDALAMNLNDLALVRATPYKLQDHITVPVEDERVVEIVKELSLRCRKRKIAITGGEVSCHDNLDGLDISITMSGFIKVHKLNQLKIGDVLVGLRSSGLHSNGFSTVRKVFGGEFRDDFVKPTKIYLDEILALDGQVDIHGMMHITGGAFTKLKVLLDVGDARIKRDHKLKPQPVFGELYERGISDFDMYKTFNCGIGFVLSVGSKDVEVVLKSLADAVVIGEVTSGSGKVVIESQFSNQEIIF